MSATAEQLIEIELIDSEGRTVKPAKAFVVQGEYVPEVVTWGGRTFVLNRFSWSPGIVYVERLCLPVLETRE